MFLPLFAIETRKTLKHPALWLGLGGLLLLLAFIVVVAHAQIATGSQPASGGLEQDVLTGLLLFRWIGILVYAVAAAVICAYDFPDRALQMWLGRGVPRPLLLLVRLGIILLSNLLLVSFAILALLGLAALSRFLFFGDVDASNLHLAALLPAILFTFWGSLPYLALTVLLAMIGRSPLFAAGGTIVYASVIESLLGRLGEQYPKIIQYLPGRLMSVLLNGSVARAKAAPRPMPDASAMSQLHAVLAAGAIFIVLSVISLIIFSRHDFSG